MAEADPDSAGESSDGFEVHLEVFSGPFDLLLGLIAKRKLDITEIALAEVTDEFIRYVRTRRQGWDLELTSEFLVVAATLLDLKAARLLPSGEVEDEEDLALLEARDLLFARLLQYRAFKQAAGILTEWLGRQSRRHPRSVRLEDRFASALPDVVFHVGPQGFAEIAAEVLTPKPPPQVGVAHVHAPMVSVREQAHEIVQRLQRSGTASFRALSADAPSRLHVVARFLALLELYREKAVAFDQIVALGELTVRWVGGEGTEQALSDIGLEFDEDDVPDEEDPLAGQDPDGGGSDE